MHVNSWGIHLVCILRSPSSAGRGAEGCLQSKSSASIPQMCSLHFKFQCRNSDRLTHTMSHCSVLLPPIAFYLFGFFLKFSPYKIMDHHLMLKSTLKNHIHKYLWFFCNSICLVHIYSHLKSIF